MIYLDHNATTPVDPLVLEEMLPFFSDDFGNAASLSHAAGHVAHRAVSTARARVAALLHANPAEITFTSSATEANNLAILGTVRPLLAARKPVHIITQPTEHPSVLEPFHQLQREGAALTLLPVDNAGRISLGDLQSAIRPDTSLVSIMTASHELGTLQPINNIGQLCREIGRGKILFHTDASQAVAKIPMVVAANHIDLLTLSAHKFHGPKGAGALYIRAKSPPVQLAPLHFGGPQERSLRPGTLNVPAIVGLGKAAELARERLKVDPPQLAAFRTYLERRLLEEIPSAFINAHGTSRLPHVTSITIPHIESEALLAACHDLALSTGAACSSASRVPSPGLLAIGLTADQAAGTLRLSLGRTTTQSDLDQAIAQIAQSAARLRRLNPRTI